MADLDVTLHYDADGLRLCRIFPGEDLRLCEQIHFADGRAGVELVLRRATLSGAVKPDGEFRDHWADVMDVKGEIIQTVALDPQSFKALKNHWMRCKYEAAA